MSGHRYIFPLLALLSMGGTGLLSGCGGDSPTEPTVTNVTYGETTLVVLANPVVNDANQEALPTPGTALVPSLPTYVRHGARKELE